MAGPAGIEQMMVRIIPAILSQLITLPVWAAGTTFDHSAWDRVLKAYVSQIGEVDYAALKAHRQDLGAYVAALGASSPANQPDLFPSRADELAYWINAYNAFVMKGVVDKYPTRSVRDLGALYGFFRRKDYVAGGEKISLQTIENDILRKKYADPRIHFAIVCASISCPKLSREAFTAANLDAQLDHLAREYFTEERNLSIDTKTGTVTLSAILDWYKQDFAAQVNQPPGPAALLAYVRRYVAGPRKSALESLTQPKVKFREYDWSINDPGSRAKARSPVERELASPTP
jgi:hypothetical protein